MNIALYYRELNNDFQLEVVRNVIKKLKELKINVFLPKDFLGNITEEVESYSADKALAQDIDYLISIGGDGTFLDTVTLVRDTKIPVLGVNTGRLGFLAGIMPDYIDEAINEIYHENYIIESRSLLEFNSEIKVFGENNLALNDFLIHKYDTGSMITVHTYINGEFLNSYWADGLIVSTPTGSTGYSLSCGGPILFPKSGSFVITPIAPHNLNIRPIVVPDDSILSFEVEGRGNAFLLSMDARSQATGYGTSFAIQKSDFEINVIQFHTNEFLNTLINKMHWGIDNRNKKQ
jgi:NAD+ kinase